MNDYDKGKVSLILSNLVTLLGALFLHWNVFDIIFLFWVETVVIGLYTIAKLIVAQKWTALFTVPFFLVHFGAFTFGQIVTLGVISNPTGDNHLNQAFLNNILSHITIAWPAWISIIISHGISFKHNFLQKQEYKTMTDRDLFLDPYKRIYLMMIVMFLGASAGDSNHVLTATILLIISKTAMDYYSYHKQHSQNSFQKTLNNTTEI